MKRNRKCLVERISNIPAPPYLCAMDSDEDFSENNPFIGSSHQYSQGMSSSHEEQSIIHVNPVIYHTISSHSTIHISGHESLRDFKGTATIFYQIKVDDGDSVVRRRYSDFVSFRLALMKLFPTKFVAPVPEKHSLKKLITNPLNYKFDTGVIKKRIQLLDLFLESILSEPSISSSSLALKFLDPREKNWPEVLNQPPLTNLPDSIFVSSPLDPLSSTPYHSLLPTPPMSRLAGFDSSVYKHVFRPLSLKIRHLQVVLTRLYSASCTTSHDLRSFCGILMELGGEFNILSLIDTTSKSCQIIEAVGQAMDSSFINMEALIEGFNLKVKDSLQYLKQCCLVLLQLIKTFKSKDLQFEFLKKIVLSKQMRLKRLIELDHISKRLDVALQEGDQESPTIAEAIQKLRAQKKKHDAPPSTNSESEHLPKKLVSRTSKKKLSSLTPGERKLEMALLRADLDNLWKLFHLADADIKDMARDVEKTIVAKTAHMNQQIYIVARDWQKMHQICFQEDSKNWEGIPAMGLEDG